MQATQSSSSGPVSTFRRARVRGSAVLMRKSYVRSKFGQAAVEMFEARASSELRMALSLAQQCDEWVDFGLFIEATELVDKLFGRGDLALAWDVGRYAAEHNIGVWRSVVMRLVSPSVVLGIATSLWSHHYDTGRLVTKPDERGIRLSINDFLRPHRTHCLSIGGWIERTLELGRPKSVRVRETGCRMRGNEGCEFSLAWG